MSTSVVCKVRVAATAVFLAAALAPLPAAFGQGGVYIDADGVLRQVDRAGDRRLAKLRDSRRVASARGPVAAESKLRSVSLVRLQRRLQALQETGSPIPDEVRYLGGLMRVQYVFVYPEQADLVIGGPAEGWEKNRRGEVVGRRSGQPVIHLDDLVVALRSAGPGVEGAELGCSIDPTKEGLARYRELMSNFPPLKSAAHAQRMYKKMAEALGLQAVSIYGVPADSHFARVLVEADYRMKRIAVGLEKPRVGDLVSTLELSFRQGQTRGGNHLYRWWFTPKYDALVGTENGLAYELRGQGVQLLSETEHVGTGGERQRQGTSDAIAGGFATAFTDAMPELCRRSPIYASLRNLTDLAVVAALIGRHGLAQRAGWNAAWLLDPENYSTKLYVVPKRADSLAHSESFRRGRLHYVNGIAGGVTIRPAEVVTPDALRTDVEGTLAARRSGARASTGANWWWD